MTADDIAQLLRSLKSDRERMMRQIKRGDPNITLVQLQTMLHKIDHIHELAYKLRKFRNGER